MRATVFLALVGAAIGMTCMTAAADDLTVKLVSIISPIGYGEQQTLVVQTEPGAACQVYPVGAVKINFNTRPREANADGRVRWRWTVRKAGDTVKHGVEVVCMLGDRKGKLLTEFHVR